MDKRFVRLIFFVSVGVFPTLSYSTEAAVERATRAEGEFDEFKVGDGYDDLREKVARRYIRHQEIEPFEAFEKAEYFVVSAKIDEIRGTVRVQEMEVESLRRQLRALELRVAERRQLERYLDARNALAGLESERFRVLPFAAKAAMEVGELEEAERYARDVLRLAPRWKDEANYGNAIHHGHIVLGRLAWKNGDLNLAREHLLNAGRTPGSPTLESFGPDMSLALELLREGKADVVLQYLKLCKEFWEAGTERLQQWIEEIRNGEIPSFGSNLNY